MYAINPFNKKKIKKIVDSKTELTWKRRDRVVSYLSFFVATVFALIATCNTAQLQKMDTQIQQMDTAFKKLDIVIISNQNTTNRLVDVIAQLKIQVDKTNSLLRIKPLRGGND